MGEAKIELKEILLILLLSLLNNIASPFETVNLDYYCKSMATITVIPYPWQN